MSTAHVTVFQPGLLASVQDLGRHGLRRLGICPGGALDPLALRVANRLVGNADDAAGIEITMGACALRFDADSRIALAGDDFGAELDAGQGARTVLPYWSMPVAAGQTLRLQGANRWSGKAGVRSWLAVAGGIDVSPVLGSRSTDLKAGFGGHEGRALKKGDRLPIGSAAPGADRLARRAFGLRSPQAWGMSDMSDVCASEDTDELIWVRVIPGPEQHQFTPESIAKFWAEPWRITPHSNRMGSRLAGPVLARREAGDMLSSAMLPGVIQVPPSGQPIVLLGDAQTTGGYPRIGVVVEADLWKLAQAPLKSQLRFVQVDALAARTAMQVQQRYLDWVDRALIDTGWKPAGQNPGT